MLRVSERRGVRVARGVCGRARFFSGQQPHEGRPVPRDPVQPRRRRPRNPDDSQLLNALVSAAAKVERWYDWAITSQVGRRVHPSHTQTNVWGQLEMECGVTDSVLRDVHQTAQSGQYASPRGTALPRDSRGAALGGSRDGVESTQRVLHVPINRTEESICVTELDVEDDAEPENGWELLSKLLRARRYRTTQQQATDVLFKTQPDFHEGTFVRDVELVMLPAFLDAFWSQDKERLKAMCSPACYHVDVAPMLSQYAMLQSRCRLLMVSDATIFNRLVMIDDSEYGAQGPHPPRPQPVLFVAVTAQIIDCWVTSARATQSRRMLPVDFSRVAIGDPYRSEDYVFILGLIPEPRGRWVLTSYRHCRAEILQ